jgi:molybdenum cofactor cytidylyltransferase
VDFRGLLLCGGASVRFGRDKLLEKIGGEPMAVVSARHLREAMPRVLAVTRPGRQDLSELLEGAGCEVLETYKALDGLGASLAAGVKASEAADGWVVMLADMPFIRADTIGAVRAALETGAVIAAPVHRTSGARGHPVGFRGWLAEELMALAGDEGARSVIHRHRDIIRLIPVDDDGITRDIDRPEDLGA